MGRFLLAADWRDVETSMTRPETTESPDSSARSLGIIGQEQKCLYPKQLPQRKSGCLSEPPVPTETYR